ncbi:uncharacterized protein TrAFT101_009729 [Trichoderma asperellum]|uniref:uncharacterized protein n=1 Tax=Trichoderma asperellum TaxID=101201 RepID=UPI0033237AEA|nr:hypothetical protein TrAFT101_009729 [Trichoderma asperellum]
MDDMGSHQRDSTVEREEDGDLTAMEIGFSTIGAILFIVLLFGIYKSNFDMPNIIRVPARKTWRWLVNGIRWICCVKREDPAQHQPQEEGIELHGISSAQTAVASMAASSVQTVVA